MLGKLKLIIGLMMLTISFGAAVHGATLTVTKTADTNDGVCDADCSLREAVAVAIAGDTIAFASPLFDTAQTVPLNGQITIDKSLTISGRGASLTTLQNVAAAGGTSRVFLITTGTVNLSGLTMTGGNLTPGAAAGICSASTSCGGGIHNLGTLTLTNSTVSGNSASGGGIRFGGGIFNTGSLTLTNSTVSGNSLSGVNQNNGGGIYNNTGPLTITNSTVSGNSISGGTILDQGGGIYLQSSTFTMANSTVSSNSVSSTTSGDNQGGGIFLNGAAVSNLMNSTISNNSLGTGSINTAGGIFTSGTVNLTNVTVSGNSVSGGSLANIGGAGIYINSGTVNARNTISSGNLVAANFPNLLGSFSAASQNNIVDNEAAVRLAPLGFYGGATMTHALLGGSTAINAGAGCVTTATCATFNATSALSTDQRGAGRVGNVDIGAFEVNSSANGGTFRAVLPFGRQGTPYNYTLVPGNGAFNYSQSGGALPNGVNLTTAFAPEAVVAVGGTPTQTGIFNFSVTASDGVNTNVTDYQLRILVPTAAGISVSGRVLTGKSGLVNAIVTLTDSSGNVRTARTGSFGYYRFDNVAAGQTVIVAVVSKRFTFAPQVVNLSDNIADLDFNALSD